MTQPNLVRIVQRALDSGAQGNAVAAMDMFAPDVVARYTSVLPFGGELVGRAAYIHALKELNCLFHLQVVSAEVVALGDNQVLIAFDVVYTAERTAHVTRQRSVEILTFSNALVVAVDVLYSDAAALVGALGR